MHALLPYPSLPIPRGLALRLDRVCNRSAEIVQVDQPVCFSFTSSVIFIFWSSYLNACLPEPGFDPSQPPRGPAGPGPASAVRSDANVSQSAHSWIIVPSQKPKHVEVDAVRSAEEGGACPERERESRDG
ncbi:hypothetical protein BN1723_009483 [Verticillium longisporum]|uniref:Uncharacterized protein n=1 Tax=Verticillium longisporum TaxID=100787 RepID=A0A0G4KPT9_VERLO|nr:hypothetical protein BN1723_009483 [Verticillium longisporum]CRK33553.1 hypothetical protein BN1708_006052 [Verticillium longisporum]